MEKAVGSPGTEMKYLLRIRQFSGMGTFQRRKMTTLVAIRAPTVTADWGIWGKRRWERAGGSQ